MLSSAFGALLTHHFFQQSSQWVNEPLNQEKHASD